MLCCRVSRSTLSSCLAASHHPLGLPPNSPNPFTINTYKNRISNSFRMNTYRKTGEGGTPVPFRESFCSLCTLFVTLCKVMQLISRSFNHLRTLYSKMPGCGIPNGFTGEPGCTQTILYPEGFLRGAKIALGPSPPICPLPMLPKRAKIPAPLYPQRTVRGAKGACRPGFLL